MKVITIQTGYTLVSSAVPDRSTKKNPYAYTGLVQRRKNRIEVPVKCFLVELNGRKVLVDAGWSRQVTKSPVRHLGFGLYFASEPVMNEENAVAEYLKDTKINDIVMTHLDERRAHAFHFSRELARLFLVLHK